MLRVLLAEDEPAQARALAASLRLGGVAVDHAAVAIEALAHARTWAYSVVLADVCMFAEDELRELIAAAHGAPVVIVSGLPDNALAQLAEQLGASAWLGKPFSMARLEDTILDLLRRRQG